MTSHIVPVEKREIQVNKNELIFFFFSFFRCCCCCCYLPHQRVFHSCTYDAASTYILYTSICHRSEWKIYTHFWCNLTIFYRMGQSQTHLIFLFRLRLRWFIVCIGFIVNQKEIMSKFSSYAFYGPKG